MFGHVKGAFTGADETHRGFFQEAHTGTLFLDEIADTSSDIQVALLRAVQDGVIRPAGSDKDVSVNLRIISATNRDLRREVAAGRFREDLFYRLAGIIVEVPPLRERSEDILPLARCFVQQFAAGGRDPLEIDSDVREPSP